MYETIRRNYNFRNPLSTWYIKTVVGHANLPWKPSAVIFIRVTDNFKLKLTLKIN